MPKHTTIIVAGVILLFVAFSVYAQQNNKTNLSKLNSELNNIQVQVNRGYNPELPELNEQQKQSLDAATKKVLEARRALIETELEIGLITEEEAEFFMDHLDLMDKYGQDYDPPAWNWGHGRGRGMMGHHR